MFNLLGIMLLVLLYSLGCAGYGVWVLQILPLRKSNQSFGYWVTAFLLGQGIVAALLEFISLLGIFTPIIIGLMLSLGWAGILVFNGVLRITLVSTVKNTMVAFRRERLEWKAIIILSLILLVYFTLQMFLPPVGDAASFYMVLPKLIANTQQIQSLPLPGYESFTAIGLQGEFHYAALLAFSGEMAAKLFVLPIALAGIAMLIGVGRGIGLSAKGQIIIFVAVITSSAFTNVMWDGKVDLFGAGMGLAAFYWGCKTDEGWGAVALCGLFTGFSVIAKLSYLVVLPISIFLIVIYGAYLYNQSVAPLRLRWRGVLLALVIFGFCVALPFIPNMIKNAALFGEPLAPFISSSGQAITDQSWFSPITTERIMMSYPFAFVFGGFAAQYGTVSPLLLAFLPLLLFIPRSIWAGWNNKLTVVSVAAFVGVLVWLIVRPSVFAPRYIMPPLLILIVPISVGAAYVIEHLITFRVVYMLITVATLATVLITFGNPNTFLNSASENINYALETTHAPCERVIDAHMSSCQIEHWMSQNVEVGKRVFMSSIDRYWLRSDLLQCIQRKQDLISLATGTSTEESWNLFYQAGFRYLVVDLWNLSRRLDVEQLPSWLHADQVFQFDHYFVYDVQPLRTQPPLTSACVQIGTNRWVVQKLQ
ncbi:MAG: hypothetical protein H0X30_00880 [Anaerolineae bacterium]|nr:hypothetical protein [Anaerolineae bacterium]